MVTTIEKERLISTIAELKNWDKRVAAIAISKNNWRVAPLVAIWLDSYEKGAFRTELKEMPHWYYRTHNDKPKNLSGTYKPQADALQPNTLV